MITVNIRNTKKDDKVIIRIEEIQKEDFRSRIMPCFPSICDAYNGYGHEAYYISLDDLANLILDRENLNINITVGDCR